MTTTDRMQQHSPPGVSEEIADDTSERVRAVVAEDSIDHRLGQLDQEWDAERVLFTASCLNLLAGLALGRFVHRGWFAWAAGVAAFQVQHGIQGWCPPLALIRRLRVRTRREIDEERMALAMLRSEEIDLRDPDVALEVARS